MTPAAAAAMISATAGDIHEEGGANNCWRRLLISRVLLQQ